MPQWVKAKMPCGIERLNTINCRYYGIIGISRKVRDWYTGMFMEWIFDWYEADHVLDLQKGLWWSTGRNDVRSAHRLEEEYALRMAVKTA
jgi:hypothetical protein